MRRLLSAAAALALGFAAARADDPAQPAPRAAQPRPGQPRPMAAARLTQLEEDVEVLEAQRDARRAHVKGAEVGVRLAAADLDNTKHLLDQRVVGKQDMAKVALGLEAAKAQLEVRVAELKEAEVKVKFARKRLGDARAGGERPAPQPRPAPRGEPKPGDGPGARAAEPAVAELKAVLAKLGAEAAKVAADLARSEADAKAAEAELAALKKAAALGRVRAGAIEAAEAKVARAREVAAQLAKQREAVEASVTELQKKLRELEK